MPGNAQISFQSSNFGLPIVRIAKFVGTVSLGLLTGLSYSLSTVTYPALLHLPTAPLAAQTNNYVRTTARASQRWLSRICTGAFVVAWLVSPRRLKHPYLIYTAIACQLGASLRIVDRVATKLYPAAHSSTTFPKHSRTQDLGESAVMVGQGSSSEDEEDVNGEVVRREVEKSQAQESIRTGFWGLGFVLGIVGLWGDLL